MHRWTLQFARLTTPTYPVLASVRTYVPYIELWKKMPAPARMMELESQQEVATTSVIVTNTWLRLLAAATSLAAAVVVATNHQQRWGIRVDFTLFQVWIAFVATNLLCAVYAAATAALMRRLVGRCWLHHVDQLVVNLEAAATAGAGAVGSIAMWGNEASGWYSVCRMYRRYCNVGAGALVLSFAAVLLLGFACAQSRYPKTPAPSYSDQDRRRQNP